jgi:hypothetical protein
MKDTKFMTAKEKELVLKQWKSFVKEAAETKIDDYYTDKYGNTMPLLFKKFTKNLYTHIINHCSFIAHFNHASFFGYYFGNPERTVDFFKQFDDKQGLLSAEYGMNYWVTSEDYNDINMAMVEAVRPYLEKIYSLALNETKVNKQLQIKQLQEELTQLEANE